MSCIIYTTRNVLGLHLQRPPPDRFATEFAAQHTELLQQHSGLLLAFVPAPRLFQAVKANWISCLYTGIEGCVLL